MSLTRTAALVVLALGALACKAGEGGSNATDANPDSPPDFSEPTVLFDHPKGRAANLHVDDRFVYFSSKYDAFSVRRGLKTGGNHEKIGPWSGDGHPTLFATDSDFVFWLFKDHVNRLPQEGGPIVELPLGKDHGYGSLASDAAHLYSVTASCHRSTSMKKDGSELVAVDNPDPLDTGGATSILVDEKSLYCSNYQHVYVKSTSGTDPLVPLFVVEGDIQRVEQDADHLYFMENQAGPGFFYLKQGSKEGGKLATLVTLDSATGRLILYDGAQRTLYFTHGPSSRTVVHAYSLDLLVERAITEPLPDVLGMAQDEDFLYWGDYDAVFKMKKPEWPAP